MTCTIHSFPDKKALLEMIDQVADKTGHLPERIAEELMADWKFSAPRMDDIAVACINPQDPDAALAPDFKESYRKQWWTEILSDALDGVYRHLMGQPNGISRLAIQLPLQHGKTLHGSQLFPAVLLGRAPTLRIGSFGYKHDYAKRSITHCGALLRSRRFQERYPGVFVGLHKKIAGKERKALEKSLPDTQEVLSISYQGQVINRELVSESRGKGRWRCGGSYVSGSWPSPPNGLSLDVAILEDPYRNWGDVQSRAYNQTLWDSYMGTISQRLQTGHSAIVTSFTPWAEEEIFSRIFLQWRKEGHEVTVIKFPAWGREDTEEEKQLKISRSYDKRKKHVYVRNEEGLDIRTEWGEVLDPWKDRLSDKHGVSYYEQKKREPMRERFALYELAPRSQDTDRFPKHMWKWFQPAVKKLPFETVLLSLDANASADNTKVSKKHSFAVCGVWCFHENNFYRVDEYRAKPTYGQLVHDLLEFSDKWKNYSHTFLLEEAGHGRALYGDNGFIGQMTDMGYTVVATKQEERKGKLPKGWSRMTKEEHWSMIEVPLQFGRVFLPKTGFHPVTDHWVHTQAEDGKPIEERLGFLEECQRGRHPNDRIDEMAQAICYLQNENKGLSWVDVADSFGLGDYFN